MPNSANRSKDQSNIVKPKRTETRTSNQDAPTQSTSSKPAPAPRSKGGDTGRSSSQGRKEASGGSPND